MVAGFLCELMIFIIFVFAMLKDAHRCFISLLKVQAFPWFIPPPDPVDPGIGTTDSACRARVYSSREVATDEDLVELLHYFCHVRPLTDSEVVLLACVKILQVPAFAVCPFSVAPCCCWDIWKRAT